MRLAPVPGFGARPEPHRRDIGADHNEMALDVAQGKVVMVKHPRAQALVVSSAQRLRSRRAFQDRALPFEPVRLSWPQLPHLTLRPKEKHEVQSARTRTRCPKHEWIRHRIRDPSNRLGQAPSPRGFHTGTLAWFLFCSNSYVPVSCQHGSRYEHETQFPFRIDVGDDQLFYGGLRGLSGPSGCGV